MRRIISLLLLGVCFIASTNLLANSTHVREIHMAVKFTDRLMRTLTLTYDQGYGPQRLIWNANTQFLYDWSYESSDEPSVGVHGTVFTHSPFFGKPFAVKVVWSIAAERKGL